MASWSRDVVLELIHLYESKPCLYAISTEDYHNRLKKNKAYEEICNHICLLRPGTTPDDIKSKINGIRTQFLAEKGKMKKSLRSGCSTDEIYQPALWCYKQLEFLNSHIKPRSSTSNFQPVQQGIDISNEKNQWLMLEECELPATTILTESENNIEPATGVATPTPSLNPLGSDDGRSPHAFLRL